MKKGMICLLVLVLLFSFAACGSEDGKTDNGDNAGTSDTAKSETNTPEAAAQRFLEACAKGDHEAYKAVLSKNGKEFDDEEFYDFSGELRYPLSNDGGSETKAVNVELRIEETRNLEGEELEAYLQEEYEIKPGDYGITKGTVLMFTAYLNGQEIDDDCFAFATLENGAWKLMDFTC